MNRCASRTIRRMAAFSDMYAFRTQWEEARNSTPDHFRNAYDEFMEAIENDKTPSPLPESATADTRNAIKTRRKRLAGRVKPYSSVEGHARGGRHVAEGCGLVHQPRYGCVVPTCRPTSDIADRSTRRRPSRRGSRGATIARRCNTNRPTILATMHTPCESSDYAPLNKTRRQGNRARSRSSSPSAVRRHPHTGIGRARRTQVRDPDRLHHIHKGFVSGNALMNG